MAHATPYGRGEDEWQDARWAPHEAIDAANAEVEQNPATSIAARRSVERLIKAAARVDATPEELAEFLEMYAEHFAEKAARLEVEAAEAPEGDAE